MNRRSRWNSKSRLLFSVITLGLLWLTLPGSLRADTVYTYTGNAYTFCDGTYVSSGVIVNNVCQGPYALSLTFDTTLSGKQLDNLVLTSSVCRTGSCLGTPLNTVAGGDLTASVFAFSFTDGTGFSITQANATQFSFDVTTDSKGNIQAWAIYAVISPPSGTGAYSQALTESGLGLGSEGDNSLLESYDGTEAGTIANGLLSEVGGGFTNSTDVPGILSVPAQWTKTTTKVPEPSSLFLLGAGIFALAAVARGRLGESRRS